MKIKITLGSIIETIVCILIFALLLDTIGWMGGIFNSINTDRYTYRSRYDGSLRQGTKRTLVDFDFLEW